MADSWTFNNPKLLAVYASVVGIKYKRRLKKFDSKLGHGKMIFQLHCALQQYGLFLKNRGQIFAVRFDKGRESVASVS